MSLTDECAFERGEGVQRKLGIYEPVICCDDFHELLA